jgi:hypothetical protein
MLTTRDALQCTASGGGGRCACLGLAVPAANDAPADVALASTLRTDPVIHHHRVLWQQQKKAAELRKRDAPLASRCHRLGQLLDTLRDTPKQRVLGTVSCQSGDWFFVHSSSLDGPPQRRASVQCGDAKPAQNDHATATEIQIQVKQLSHLKCWHGPQGASAVSMHNRAWTGLADSLPTTSSGSIAALASLRVLYTQRLLGQS